MRSVDDRPRELQIATEHNEAGDVLVTVSDTGQGIAPENLERVFKIFLYYKVERGRNRTLDLPLRRRGPWWLLVCQSERTLWRKFSIHLARRCRSQKKVISQVPEMFAVRRSRGRTIE